MMKATKTDRGFILVEFEDGNGQVCSLQQSSAVRDEGLCWLGVTDPPVMVRAPDQGWENVPLPEGALVMSRMHLTQAQVRALLPYLTHFAETGEIPEKTS